MNLVRRELAKHYDVTKACNSLVSTAYDAGSVDNITAIVIVFNVSIRQEADRDASLKILPSLRKVANEGHGIASMRMSAAS